MAVDSAQKRFNMISFSSVMADEMMFQADGSVDADDRVHMLHLYGGIALAEPSAALAVFSGRRRRMAGRRLSSILVILMLAGCASKPCSTGEYNCVDFSQAWDAAVEARKEVIRERSI